jgi:hypothetical protein
MKVLWSVLTIFCLFLFSSCKSSSNPTGSGGIGGIGGIGGGGGGSVTFTITQAAGNTGIIFYATPSAAVVISDVNVSVPAASYTKDYPDPSGTVYQANAVVEINEFTGVATGQKWVFVFTGHLGSATGTAFSVTSNYTVP